MVFVAGILIATGATSCKKQSGEALPAATQKGEVRIERFEGIERGKGLSGDILLAVSNGLRSNITLTRAEVEINFGDKNVGSLVLTGDVFLPKKSLSSVRIPASLSITSPILSHGILTRIMRGEFDKLTLTINAEAKVGLVRKRIYKENIPLKEAMRSVGISTDGLKKLTTKKNEDE